MAGADTLRGIAYQQAHAIHFIVDLVEEFPEHQLRIEGTDDVIDIEVFDASGQLVSAHQIKSRTTRSWTPKLIADVLKRWAALNQPDATFTFITDGDLGPGATDLRAALEREDTERTKAVADALGGDTRTAALLRNARIRVDPSPVGVLLDSAQRRIASMLDPLDRDRDIIAEQRVHSLFTVLTQRAALPNPADRLFTATELRELVGGEFGVSAEHQWPGELKDDYIGLIPSAPSHLVPLTLDADDGSTQLPIDTLLTADASVLAGRTGTGKSSVIELLQTAAAAADTAVIVCRAEIFTPGRLDALVADSLSFTTGRPTPTRAGRHALADPATVVIIDGVSEVPDSIAEALVADIAEFTGRPVRATVVVVGRDATLLRRAVRRAPRINTYAVSPLPQDAQKEIVRKVLGASPSQAEMLQIVRVATKVLRDGARNPMLFTIYLEASRDAPDAMSRAAVYERFILQLAARAPATDARTHISALGVVFARLLALQRRYSDRHEWIELTDAASFPDGDGEQLRAAALHVGLVVELGATGTVAPSHDSFADYLAGVAVASGQASFPDALREAHAEWVIFASELGVDVSEQVSSDLPFHTLRIAESDTHIGDTSDFGSRTAHLLSKLLGTDELTVTATEELDGRWSLRAFDASGKLRGRAAVEQGRGPLYAATRLWRLLLRARVQGVRPEPTKIPTTVEEAQSAIVAFLRQRRRDLAEILDTFLPGQRSRLLEHLRPLGVSFHVGDTEEQWGTCDFPLTYQRSANTRVLAAEPEHPASHTSVSYFLDGGPRHAAAADVKRALEHAVDKTGWLS